MNKSLSKLRHAIDNFVVTPEMISRMENRIDAMETRFTLEEEQKHINKEWLNREYTL